MRLPSQRLLYSFAALLLTALPAQAAVPQTEMVSVSSVETQGNGESLFGAISGDVRYVAFASDASNLVLLDTNGRRDIFVRDRQKGETSLVSISSFFQGNGDSDSPSIAAGGRYVAFASAASNLEQTLPGDTNGVDDVFVHDLQTAETRRVSIASDGTQGNRASSLPALSADGRYVCFASEASTLVTSDTNFAQDIFVHDRQSGETRRVSVNSAGLEANGSSSNPSISADGRYVAFESAASNLVAGDSNGVRDVFVHDLQTGETRRVSVDSAGRQALAGSYGSVIAAGGGQVVFYSMAGNLVAGDSNGISDTFLHELATGTTVRISVTSTGQQAVGPFGSSVNVLSADGRHVVFASSANNLVANDDNNQEDWFLKDTQTGAISRFDFGAGDSLYQNYAVGGISADARYLVFDSAVADLVPGDSNNARDVFVRSPLEAEPPPPPPPPPPQKKYLPAIPLLLLLAK